jgi:hypothetical protein
MLERLFPRQFDNTYRGHWLGLAIFVLCVGLKAFQSLMSVVNTYDTATKADGISFIGYSAAQTNEVLALFALLGLGGLIIPVQSAVVLVRYRAMIPFMYLMLLSFMLAGRAVHLFHPAFAAEADAPHPIGFYLNLTIMAVTALGFVLSLLDRRPAIAAAAPSKEGL